MKNESKLFEYKYSAKEQAEIKKIRERYVAPERKEVDKMELLRRLDASVVRKGNVAALIVGIVGALVMGMGMSLVMTDLGQIIGVENVIPVGVGIGVVGMLMAAFAYPLYRYVTKKERERVAPEIIRLTDELMK